MADSVITGGALAALEGIQVSKRIGADEGRAALTSFLKRHSNPEIATLIQRQGCALLGRFRLS
ncbi:hypothetical protein KAT72_03615 [Aeromonas popoffii]|uniref:Uncharacterized protein n=1 Tax=Aeromonas popoffii TaxID=70856 RepID=A0ABS5GLY6_9GAMM|nr:hypothetical protein [Aeromonas popoffii]